MKLVIGIDFDNTIACYDTVFCDVAKKLGILEKGQVLSKSEVKQLLLKQDDGDINWQKLQGKVYGKYMHMASIYSGVIEFLYLCKLKGHDVVIVSHKSEYGHFDEEKISLRNAAMEWLQDIGIVGKNFFSIEKDKVYFEPTRELKIAKLKELGCDYFIDDLVEVFHEPTFPENIKKILFKPKSKNKFDEDMVIENSWRQIRKKLFDDWSESDIVNVIKEAFPKLNIEQASLIKGRGNSRIYRLSGKSNDGYSLKIYPDMQYDPRPRLKTEYTACQYLERLDFPVMKPKTKDSLLNWGVYEWIEGETIDSPDDKFINDAVEFIKCLHNISRQGNERNQFDNASEACLSGQIIIEQIEMRLQRLNESESKDLNDYIKAYFLPNLELLKKNAKEAVSDSFDKYLPEHFQILNPSDFGSHNAIKNINDRTIFIDFEYFGWDDPVKLVSDFYLHPGMALSSSQKEKWINATSEIFTEDPLYQTRLEAYLPLYALRWCLILLNEFLPERLANRLDASNRDDSNVKQILTHQLNKSKALLNQVVEGIYHYGSTFETS